VRSRSLVMALLLALCASPRVWPAHAQPSAPAAPSHDPNNLVGEDPYDAQAAMRGDMRYVSLSPLLVSVIRHSDVHKLVTLLITIELEGPDKRAKVEDLMPRLRDGFISDLQRVFGTGIYDDRTVDLVLVKKRLLAISRKIVGAGVVHDVLILNAMERGV
jgi:hypothetical protein